ncbi:hypothetical protein BE04_24700 [Sorangium cellulosum]|uniref:Gp5/Type VI secretion system Vgr C-terminal trimerisation domain-containing protein n=1 Tax=Sorangium cellulosum TaxID=56 RepID=A0A150P3A0_SORCE|nr:hypothetical protein BE04_24700 [Sorangium cellulosum]
MFEVTLRCPELPDELLVQAAHVVEAISSPTRAVVHAISGDDIDVEAPIGRAALLEVSVDAEPVRHFQLVVTSVRFDGVYRGAQRRYVIELAHELELLSLRADVRMFQDKDAREIVAAVLEGAGVPSAHVSWSLSRPPWKRTYCVQYRETDFAFLSRLCEFEGIFYFAHDDGASTHVTFADSQGAFPPIEGESVIHLADDHHGSGVHQLEIETCATPDQVSVGDYNFETPGVVLTKRHAAADSPRSDSFEYPAGHRTSDQGATLARLRLEALAAESTIGRGRSDRMSFRAGSWFELGEASRDELSGQYLLTRVEHHFAPQPDEGASRAWYKNDFTCIPHATPFRPPRATARARVRGVHSAVVTGPSGSEIHTDELGRMKARFFWDREDPQDDTSSCWIRVVQLPLGASQAIARVGWEMAVVYVDGDPDRPVGIARLYNAEKTSPYGYPAAKTRMALQTPSSPASGKSNEIRMEDGGSAMEFFMNASKDWDTHVNNNRTDTVAVDEKLEIGVDGSVTIGANETVQIGASRTASVSADEGVSIGADRTKTVGGSETVTVSGNISVDVKGSDSETTGGSHTTLAAMGVERTSTGSQSLTVGGSMVSVGALGVSHTVVGALSETVGGAKIAVSGASVTESVVGAYASTVGGVSVQAAGGNRQAATKGRSAVTVGGLLSANAAGKVSIRAKKVAVRVMGVANLLGGGGVLTLTPGSASFVGLVTLDASGSIKISGNPNLVG